MILTGNNLGSRQKCLNFKVQEAVSRNENFEDIKARNEQTDVDKLFKIDVASQYRNVDYIVEVLKSGDSLHISRALKCHWLYDENHTDIINPEYLEVNIFPFMSVKMKVKLLSTISCHIRDENRVIDFFSYCKNNRMVNIAHKFLIFAPESYKLKILKENIRLFKSMEQRNCQFFIKNSFTLADAYLTAIEWSKNQTLKDLAYLFSVSNEKYLNLYEKHAVKNNRIRFSLRMSKCIMKKYKNRVMEKPFLYVEQLDENILIKYSTVKEVKTYLVALLPEEENQFWYIYSGRPHRKLLHVIPIEERFPFLKEIFTNKYPEVKFETNTEFLERNFHMEMTAKEREDWALRHLENKELLAPRDYYHWYEFINFDKAFEEVKKIVSVTPDAKERNTFINILIKSAKNQSELERLLDYYYVRHVNESAFDKETFVDQVTKHHDVFNLGDDCWTAFNKILYSLDIYNILDVKDYRRHDNRIIAFLYNLVNNKEMPADLKKYVESVVKPHDLPLHIAKFDKEKKQLVFLHFLQVYVNNISSFDNQKYDNNVQRTVREYISCIQSLFRIFDKPHDEIPDVVKKYMALDPNTVKKRENSTEAQLLRHLKQESTILLAIMPTIKSNIKEFHSYKLRQLLRKLKVYFAFDVAQDFVQFFTSLLDEKGSRNCIFTGVYGILQLGDEKLKSDFLLKHVPSNPKIDHVNIDSTHLYIQEAICRFACFSRPPVNCADIVKYIKGDYVQYCLPMFNLYMSHLPQKQCLEFIHSILNSPVSVQKHALRSAFRCFNVHDLKQFILGEWKKTKNISLRMIIFKSLFDYINKNVSSSQKELFEIFKTFMLDLNENDHIEVLDMLPYTYKVAKHLKGDFIVTAWQTVEKFPSPRHVNIMIRVMNCITHNLQLVPKEVVQKIVEKHVNEMFVNKNIICPEKVSVYEGLINAKWELTTAYICTYSKDEGTSYLVKSIIKHISEMWNDNYMGVYVARNVCRKLINGLIRDNYHSNHDSNYADMNNIFEAILLYLHKALPLREIYMIVWRLKLTMISNRLIDSEFNKFKFENSEIDRTALLENIREMALNYISELRRLITELMERKLYFISISNYLGDMITDILEDIMNLFKSHVTISNRCVIEDVNSNTLCVLVATGLAESKTHDEVMLAIHIMPSDAEHHLIASFLNTVNAFNNFEVSCLAYQKFVVQNGYTIFNNS